MNKILIKTIKGLLFAIPLVSMVVVSDMYFPFITGKNFLFRFAVELALCLYIALAFADKRYKPAWDKILASFGLFTAVMFVADIFAIDSTKALWSNFERMEGFIMLAHLFAYFLVLVSVFREKKDWSRMLFCTLSVSIFMTMFGYLQLFGGAVINQGGARLDGTLGNSAYMATYMVFHIFFLLYLWVANGNKVKGIADAAFWGSVLYIVYYLYYLAIPNNLQFTKFGGFVLAFAMFFALKIAWFRYSKVFEKIQGKFVATLYTFLIIAESGILYYTATRGAILGLIGGLVVSATIVAFCIKNNKIYRNAAIGILGCIFVFILLFIGFRTSDFVQKSPVLNRFASISLHDASQARAIIWPIAFKAVKENPVLGWGQDNFIYAFAKYYKPELIRHEPWFDRTHNAFLDWLVAGGVLGFVAYLSLYVFAFLNLWKSKVFDVREKAILIGLFSAYGFLSLFIFDNLISYYLFILLLGLSALREKEEDKRYRPEEISLGIFASIGIMFVILCFFVNIRPLNQNFTLTEAIRSQPEGYMKNLELIQKAVNGGPVGRFESLEQMVSVTSSLVNAPNIPDDDKREFVIATANEFQKYMKQRPLDVRGKFMFGTFLLQIGLYNDAISVLNEAYSLSPKKQHIYYALANAYFIKADRERDDMWIDKGLEYLKTAYELAPQMDDPRNVYIKALLGTNHLKEIGPILKTLPNPEGTLPEDIVFDLKQKGLLK